MGRLRPRPVQTSRLLYADRKPRIALRAQHLLNCPVSQCSRLGAALLEGHVPAASAAPAPSCCLHVCWAVMQQPSLQEGRSNAEGTADAHKCMRNTLCGSGWRITPVSGHGALPPWRGAPGPACRTGSTAPRRAPAPPQFPPFKYGEPSSGCGLALPESGGVRPALAVDH